MVNLINTWQLWGIGFESACKKIDVIIVQKTLRLFTWLICRVIALFKLVKMKTPKAVLHVPLFLIYYVVNHQTLIIKINVRRENLL